VTSPSVSVIVPVYRTPPELLHRGLRSILGQTLSDIELIAIDDASPDDCPRILDAVAAEDPRAKVIHRPVNGRAGAARNPFQQGQPQPQPKGNQWYA